MKYLVIKHLIVALVACTTFLSTAQALGQDDENGDFSLDEPLLDQSKQTIDQIIAVVNDDVILESELDEAVAEIQQQQGDQMEHMPPNMLRSQVLDQLIMRRLQVQQADKYGIKASREEMQRGIAQIAQRNNMDTQQFAQALQQNGMSMDQLQEHISDEIKVSKVRRQEVMGKISVTEGEIDRYLKNRSLRLGKNHEYHLKQIHLAIDEDSDSTAKGVARNRLQELRQNIIEEDLSFEEAADTIADDPETDMGWVASEDLPESFDTALANLSPGDISSVFEGEDGLYLIKLEDERGGEDQDEPDDDEQVMVTQARLQHIVISPNEIRSPARARQLAEQIRERLQAGDDFNSLAKKYSDDKATARQGGDLGWTDIDKLPPDSQQQLETLGKGQISEIFQASDGYEIIKLLDKRERDKTRQAQRNKIRQTLGNNKLNEEGELWMRKLRDEAYIDIRLPDYQPSPDMTGTP